MDHPVAFGLPFHPYADLFPLLEGQEFDDLVTDIEQNGLLSPIILLKGHILDGRNRYLACLDAMIPVRTEEYTGKLKPLDYVISANLKRRHLDANKRASIAARIANMSHGGDRSGKQAEELPLANQVTQAAAGKIMNVSERSVRDAKKVHDKGVPELVKLLDRGEVSVEDAAKIAEMPKADQAATVKLTRKALHGVVKKTQRAARERALAEATRMASDELGVELFNVIYADPPWKFEPYSQDTGMDRAADNHYPTESTEALCAMEVPAADDCVLFLWATVPMLPDAMQVMAAWGFSYRSNYVWVKDRVGTGYWARNKHELLLIGVKGSVPAPAPGEQFDSVVVAAVGRHSEKPALFAEMIEEMFPNAALLEMFARHSRAGWTTWGNEACYEPRRV